MAKQYIEREAAVVMADYAEDEHPYDKDPKRPETFSAYHEGWAYGEDWELVIYNTSGRKRQ